MTDSLRTQLEELAGIVTNCEAGVIRANAKGELAMLVVNNLPTILSALEAVEWVYPKSLDDMPAKPGKERYEYVDCLILHKGDLLFRPWNCEYQVFDDEQYDDFFCEWSAIDAYQIVRRPLGPLPEGGHGN